MVPALCVSVCLSVCLCVQVLPLVLDIEDDPSFVELLEQVRGRGEGGLVRICLSSMLPPPHTQGHHALAPALMHHASDPLPTPPLFSPPSPPPRPLPPLPQVKRTTLAGFSQAHLPYLQMVKAARSGRRHRSSNAHGSSSLLTSAAMPFRGTAGGRSRRSSHAEEPELAFDGSNPFLPLFQVMFALQEEWNQGGALDEVCA